MDVERGRECVCGRGEEGARRAESDDDSDETRQGVLYSISRVGWGRQMEREEAPGPREIDGSVQYAQLLATGRAVRVRRGRWQ